MSGSCPVTGGLHPRRTALPDDCNASAFDAWSAYAKPDGFADLVPVFVALHDGWCCLTAHRRTDLEKLV